MAYPRERTCIDCGEPISIDRILAKPKATRCIDCQADAEHMGLCGRHKMQYQIRFRGDEIESMDAEIVKAEES